jgi:hypothetical protein
VAFNQPLQNALPEVEQLGRGGVAEQPQVEDPQRERVLAAPGELGACRVEGGRGSAAEQVRGGGQLGWREVLDALTPGIPVRVGQDDMRDRQRGELAKVAQDRGRVPGSRSAVTIPASSSSRRRWLSVLGVILPVGGPSVPSAGG